MSHEVDAVVIGAGLSGLAATKTLLAQHKSVILVEARNRIGGRAFTDLNTFGVPFDHGCSWIHSEGINPLKSIIESCGFELLLDDTYDVFINKNKLSEEHKSKYNEARDEMNELIKNIKSDLPLSELFPKTSNVYKNIAAKIMAFVSGLEMDNTSAQAMLEEECGPAHKLLKKGLGTFVAHYGKGVPVELNTTVTEIDYRNKTIVVKTNKGQIKAKKVVLTVPLGVLLNEKIKFTPELPLSKQEGIIGFQMGCFNKIALMLDSKISDLDNHYALIADNTHPLMGVSLNLYGSGLIIAYVSGKFAQALEKEGEQSSIDYALERLSKIFGSKIKKMYQKGFATSWMQDRFSYGSYSAPLPGMCSSRAKLMEPIENRIFFAGEACHTKWMTQLPGAYLSGIENARLLIESQE